MTAIKAFFVGVLAVCLVCLTIFVCRLLDQGTKTLAGFSKNGDAIATHFEAAADAVKAVGPGVNTAVTRIGDTAGAAQTLLRTANGTTRRVNATLDQVNRPCAPGPCGTLADVDKTLDTFRGTAGQVEIAANHEDKNLAVMDAQERQLFSDLHATSVNANALLTQGAATATDVHQLADQVAHPSQKLTLWGLIKRLF